MGISNKKVPHPRHVLCDRVGTFDFAKGAGYESEELSQGPEHPLFCSSIYHCRVNLQRHPVVVVRWHGEQGFIL